MSLDISVRFENVSRGADGSVSGKVNLTVSGSVLGQDFDFPVDARNFSFPQGGEQQVYDQSFSAGVFSLKLTASVYESGGNQCCIRGHAHVDAPIGGGIGKDLDENCTPIP